jgi:polysaccharide export outer membrane protein
MVSMANRSDLSVRVDPILNPRQRRGRPGRLAAATIIALVAVSGGTVASLRAALGDPADNPALRTLEVERAIGPRGVITGWDPPFRRTLLPVPTPAAPNAARQRQAATPVQEPPLQTPLQIPLQIPTSANSPTAFGDYLIGPDDVLLVTFGQNKEMSAEVVVRPDGKISLPFLNDVVAAGLTIEQLRVQVAALGKRFIEAPQVTIVAKAINSRKVFIVGEIWHPGMHTLTGAMTVVQLISTAGGLSGFAKRDSIFVLRREAGQTVTLPFDYAAFIRGQNLEQNILLKPGDSVIVP